MSENKKILFGLIGAGHIGLRHAEMIMRHPEAELTCICDVRPAADLALPENIPLFQDVEAMLLAHPSCDVITVCSPNGLHAKHALLALQHQKHVVIEKPMALTKADCEKVIFNSLQAHKQVFCVMQNRYSPPSIWLRELIDDNILGEVYMVHINCFWNRDHRYYNNSQWKGSLAMDGGTLFTQFSHFVDIMYWLFGDITNIQSRFRDFNHERDTEFEDSGIISFDFTAGGMGTFNFTTSVRDTNFESSMTVIAEKGTVKLGGQYMNEVQYCHITDYVMPQLPASNPANDYGHYKGSAANHGYIIENVVDTLLGRTNITTNALEGMKVVEIIERIYLSAPRLNRHS